MSPCGAPGNFIAWYVVAGTLRSVTPRPPIRLAEPGSTCSVVTPPASAVAKPGSCGQTECSAHTAGRDGARRLVAVVRRADAGARVHAEVRVHVDEARRDPAALGVDLGRVTTAASPGPTATILPSRISTSAPSSLRPAPSSTVALRMSVGVLAAGRYVDGYGSFAAAALHAQSVSAIQPSGRMFMRRFPCVSIAHALCVYWHGVPAATACAASIAEGAVRTERYAVDRRRQASAPGPSPSLERQTRALGKAPEPMPAIAAVQVSRVTSSAAAGKRASSAERSPSSKWSNSNAGATVQPTST